MRRARILERIQREGGVTLAEVARLNAMSNMTAHRDLEHLAREGLVERVRGGARAVGTRAAEAHHPTAWDRRIGDAAAAKAAIAEYAATLVRSGATIFLDASSTALALADRLIRKPPLDLTLVTNSPMIAAEIRADAIHVVVCPGELDQRARTITGRWTTEFIRRLNFDLAFVSSAGVTLEAGLTTSRGPIGDVLRAARDVSARTVALVDSAKFGRASLISIAPVGALDLVISDRALDAELATRFRAAGARLHLV